MDAILLVVPHICPILLIVNRMDQCLDVMMLSSNHQITENKMTPILCTILLFSNHKKKSRIRVTFGPHVNV